MSKFRYSFNSIQTLKSRLHGNLCHIRFGDLCSYMPGHEWGIFQHCPTPEVGHLVYPRALDGLVVFTSQQCRFISMLSQSAKTLACVAGARKGSGDGEIGRARNARREGEGKRKLPFPLSRAPRISRAPNFPLSLPLSSACHAGYKDTRKDINEMVYRPVPIVLVK